MTSTAFQYPSSDTMDITIWKESDPISQETRKLFQDETFIIVFIIGIILVILACSILIGCIIHCKQKAIHYRRIDDRYNTKQRKIKGTEMVAVNSYSQLRTGTGIEIEEEEEEEEKLMVDNTDGVKELTQRNINVTEVEISEEKEEEEEKAIDHVKNGAAEVEPRGKEDSAFTRLKSTAIEVFMKVLLPLSGSKLLSGSDFHLFLNHII